MKPTHNDQKFILMKLHALLARLRSGQTLHPNDQRAAIELAGHLKAKQARRIKLSRTEQDFLRGWQVYSQKRLEAVHPLAERAIHLSAHAARISVTRLSEQTRDPLERMFLAGTAQAAAALEEARDTLRGEDAVQFMVDMDAWVEARRAERFGVYGVGWHLRGQMTEHDRAYLRGYMDALCHLDFIFHELELGGMDATSEEQAATLMYFMPVTSMRYLRGEPSKAIWAVKEDRDGWGGMRDVLTVVMPLLRGWTATVDGVTRPLKPFVRGDLLEFGMRWVSVASAQEEIVVIERRMELVDAVNAARDAREAGRAAQEREAALEALRAQVQSPALVEVLRLGGQYGGAVPMHRVPQRLRGVLRAGEKAGMLRERGSVIELTADGLAAAQLLAS